MHTTHMHNLCLHTSLSEGRKIDDFQAKKGRGWYVHRWACGFLRDYMLRRKGSNWLQLSPLQEIKQQLFALHR